MRLRPARRGRDGPFPHRGAGKSRPCYRFLEGCRPRLWAASLAGSSEAVDKGQLRVPGVGVGQSLLQEVHSAQEGRLAVGYIRQQQDDEDTGQHQGEGNDQDEVLLFELQVHEVPGDQARLDEGHPEEEGDRADDDPIASLREPLREKSHRDLQNGQHQQNYPDEYVVWMFVVVAHDKDGTLFRQGRRW